MIERTRPWMVQTWDELWESVFGPGITRSWMVWSDGHCPSCGVSVPMYHWKIDPFGDPWKLRCPHCRELFPKNDFEAFYRSGIDSSGFFRPERADRSLLISLDPEYPGRDGFGVDDGEGYVEGKDRWRFIGAYLVYGQWKQRILAGIDALSAAWLVSGEIEYALRAALMLDRVADIYPDFDFADQGLVYEERPRAGYVSNWHDSCRETRMLVEAYDRVYASLTDETLISYLCERAMRHGLSNPKNSAALIRANIENRILHDTLSHREKIYSNFPHEEQTCLTIEMVLKWPRDRKRLLGMLDTILTEATAVDGVTGEKGLMGYATIGPRALVVILGQFERVEPGLLGEILQRHPRIRDHYRFHIDTWCLYGFYPQEGDGGGFNQDRVEYFEMLFDKAGVLEPGVNPGPWSLLGTLFLATGDPAFAQVLYRGNGRTTEGLPHDLFAEDPKAFQLMIGEAVKTHGDLPPVTSVNKPEWHLAILRSGQGDQARALWIDYDTGGRHCHADTMNIGLFACGLDLLPDFGYPPVQYGGWFSDRAEWYKSSTAHNTVVVDGRNSIEGAGRVGFWMNRDAVQALRVSAPEAIGGGRFERTLALIDAGSDHAYVLDVFRVTGGSDHSYLLHSFAGELRSEGLLTDPVPEYGHGALMRNFRGDASPTPGWRVEWQLDGDLAGLGGEENVFLRFHGLTSAAAVHLAESWVSGGFGEINREYWIPQLLVRRQGESSLESTFIGVLEPHRGAPFIRQIRRIPVLGAIDPGERGAGDVALEVELHDGRTDLVVSCDLVAGPRDIRIPEWGLRLNGDFCWMRRGQGGEVLDLQVSGGRAVID